MSLRSTTTAYGDIKFYGKDTYIGRSLYHYGEWGGKECEKLVELAAGGVAIDVGANIGFMSMALLASGCTVHSFEPQPALYSLLIENCPNAKHYNTALSDTKCTKTFPIVRYGDKINYGGIGFGKSELGSYPVVCVPLDDYDIFDVSLIKIDVEGHELQVLKGAERTIATWRPILYVEDDRPDKRHDLRKYIKSLGYTIEEHTTPLYRPDNFKKYSGNIWDKEYVSMNIICYP